MGNKQQKAAEEQAGTSNGENSEQKKTEAKKEKKVKEKKAKNKGKKKSKMDMSKITPEIAAMLSLDATDGGDGKQTIFSKLVNVNMVGSGVTTKAAILGQGGTTLATSDNLNITEPQIKNLVLMVHEPGANADKGIALGKDEFHYTSSKPSVIHGQGKMDKAVLCTVVASRQLLLVGVYVKEKQDQAEDMMEALQKYFIDQGI